MMSDHPDPQLAGLFADNPPVIATADADFERRVMNSVERATSRKRVLWLLVDILAVVLIWLLADPLQELVMQLLPWLTRSLVELGDGLWESLLRPVNNVASVLALLFLLFRAVYRRLRF
jgi:hypothetical protein